MCYINLIPIQNRLLQPNGNYRNKFTFIFLNGIFLKMTFPRNRKTVGYKLVLRQLAKCTILRKLEAM